MKRKIIADPLLMLISILVIISFQVYWLKDNYDREEKALQIKTNAAFQETVFRLQSLKLKLPLYDDSKGLSDPLNYLRFTNDALQRRPPGLTKQAAAPAHKQNNHVFFDEVVTDTVRDGAPLFRRRVITMMNTIRDKITDSTRNDSTSKSRTLFTMGGAPGTLPPLDPKQFSDGNNHIFNMLYRVDSLQDSIKAEEIVNDYSAILKMQNLDVPFKITREETKVADKYDVNIVTVGFAHPVTYRLLLLNTRDYLLKKIRLPILFSLFLVGVTILSFVILYRNLMRQQRLAEIKNDFISNITHELKTPIATVGVAIEALRNFNAIHDPQKTKEYLDISSGELQRLSLLVDKVLKLSMFQKREIELNKEPFDLEALIQEVLDTMKLQFEKQNAVVNFDSTGDSFIIRADKLHITSVLYNLLDNALKYSRDNLVIDVLLARAKNIFTIKVSDNGIGIAKEYTHKIFDKFFRVPTGDRHAVKGYGLGLIYVSEIIKRHMGFIYVESEYGKGSSFFIKIPAEEADTIWFDDKRRISRKQIRLSTKKNEH